MYERNWGWIPTLGNILGNKTLPERYFGPTSVSDNAFESTQRLMKISILIRENSDEIRMHVATPGTELKENVCLELDRVAKALEAMAQEFHEQSLQITKLAWS